MGANGAPQRWDRRGFLRSAAGAALAFGPAVFSNLHASAGKETINVALIGAGEQGRMLMTEVARGIPGVRFQAVCDIWPRNRIWVAAVLRRYQHGSNAYEDYREMLDKEKGLHAVLVATPDCWHAEHTVACLHAGLHVYCETEMSNTLAGARRMVEAARRSGKLLQIGRQRRSHPVYNFCRERLLGEAKLLGRITSIDGQRNRSVNKPTGWPKGSELDEATLKKYGYESMHQLRNWRWYKKLGGGPIVDHGSHQIDIYNWFLGTTPKGVIASGGTDYYDKKTHEWYDTVLSIFDFETQAGVVRAFYRVLTTNSNRGYYEVFMGDQGTLSISQSVVRARAYREHGAIVPDWDKWVKLGFIKEPTKEEWIRKADENEAALDAQEMAELAYEVPVEGTAYYQPHLENFFDAIHGQAKLTCPAEVGYGTAVTVLKVNEAVAAGRRLEFKPEEFVVA